MKNLFRTLLVSLLLVVCNESKAQFLNNLVSTATDVVSAVTGGSSVTTANLTGTWSYVNPAVELDSDNVLTSVAGSLATSQFESKLGDICSKVGISAGVCSITFSSDNSFTFTVKGKSLSGTYTSDSDAGTVALKFSAANTINIGTMNAYTTISGSTLSLLFNADALLSFVSKLSSASSNESLQTLTTLAEQYDGVKLGFEFEK